MLRTGSQDGQEQQDITQEGGDYEQVLAGLHPPGQQAVPGLLRTQRCQVILDLFIVSVLYRNDFSFNFCSLFWYHAEGLLRGRQGAARRAQGAGDQSGSLPGEAGLLKADHCSQLRYNGNGVFHTFVEQ